MPSKAYNAALPSLIGMKVNFLTVLSRVGTIDRWKCQCCCGNIHDVGGWHLRNNGIRSCGCKTKQLIGKAQTRHGGSQRGTELYSTWLAWRMIRVRCENPAFKSYARYGGRGISVCAEWQSFDTFLSDMGKKTSPSHQIDRINNEGNYEPGNCRWATPKENANNKSSNARLTAFGKTMNLCQWADHVNIPRDTLSFRIESGWPVETALTHPIRRMSNNRPNVKTAVFHEAKR